MLEAKFEEASLFKKVCQWLFLQIKKIPFPLLLTLSDSDH